MRRFLFPRRPLLTRGLVALLLLTPVLRAEPPADEKKGPANRLAQESSPYLLQHAHNPVQWYPWGAEAFERAKKENKLVFLSIGYSSCHWCHVMERESFSSDDVAKILNEHFICIKVDREERPDIDHVYMTALQVTGQNGGWPLSMFLTADGRPIFGGTYWPREDREIEGQKVPGFKSILQRVREIQKEHGKELDDQAERLAAATREALSATTRGLALVALDRELVTGAVEANREQFDKQHGGFGSPARNFRGTKFPMPPALQLLRAEAEQGNKDARDMLEFTLERMAMGGIYDHLGGGFHRYSTERTWTVPHFEKMLYDNAQLAELYAQAYRMSKKPAYRRVVEQTLDFVAREMTSSEGGFYSALDADSEGEEGKFYVWTEDEVKAALPDKEASALLRHVYGFGSPPNFEEKAYILCLKRPLSAEAADTKLTEEQLEAKLLPLRQKLLAARAARPRPFLDTKILTGWNGQMIAGYAVAGKALEKPEYTQAAVRAADLILTRLRTPEGRLRRTYSARPGGNPEARLPGCLDDYAYVVHGLLCLHDVTGEAKWLDAAKSLTDVMVKHFHDETDGGFYYTADDAEKLFARSKEQFDGAQPSSNTVAARNLVRLWKKTGDARYGTLAEKTLKAFVGSLKSNPRGLSGMAEVVSLYLEACKTVEREKKG